MHLPATPSARSASVPSLPNEYLSFRLGSVEYGIDILKVQEIRGYEQPTRIANAPGYLKGVLHLRGVIVPVMDLRIKLAQEQATFDSFTVTVILNLEQGPVGVVVDSVSDVIGLAPEQIRPTPHFDGDINADHILGLGTLGDPGEERMLILLDIEKMLAHTPATVPEAEEALA
ncbi:chemotaxis protein CheW [Rhodoferax sp. WC2427]|uniref:chemotaxis protein CheW n=1 Tax=Rhodoferax sp. WC2427 TaxID=3234144 RepID=UPI003465E8B5